MACISFGTLLPGKTVSIYPNQMIDAVELSMIATGKDRNHSGDALRRLKPEVFDISKLLVIKLPGKGNLSTKIAHYKDAIELLTVLPGQLAKETRKNFADIITRYFAGDASLSPELEANAASTHPIAQMARASLNIPETEPKKRSRELDDLEVKEKLSSIRERDLGSVEKFTKLMDSLNPAWKNDARLRLQTEDMVKNITFNTQPLITENGEVDHSISIGQVIKELGFSCNQGDLVSIGRMTAKAYRDAHSKDPPKHRQWVDGCERNVNSYTERDRALMENAVRRYFNDE